MSTPQQASLVTRTTLWILAVVALVGIASLWWSSRLAVAWENDRAQAQLRELLDTVEHPASIACFLQDRQLANEVSRGVLSNQTVAWVAIYAGETQLAQASQHLATSGAATAVASTDLEDVIVRKIISLFNTDEIIGEIRLAPDQAKISQRVFQASGVIGFLLIVQIVTIGMAMVLVVYSLITRPLRQISNCLHNLPAEQGAKLTHLAGHETDEIGGLVNYVNYLIGRLVSLLNEERQLRLQWEIEEKKFRSIFETADTGIFLIDRNGKMLSYNPACRDIMQAVGYKKADPIFRFADFFNNDEAQLRSMIETCLREGKNVQRDINLAGKNGNPDRWIHMTLSQVEDMVFQGIANDITERKLAETAAQKIAVTDALTGIFNRLGFETQLQHRLSKGYKESEFWLALMLIDLDLFKQVNDTYGHDAGDQVLIRFARLLENIVRKSDLIGRLGGDEFVVFLDYVDQPPTLEKIAQNIIAGVAEPMGIGQGRTAKIGASIGIALGKAQNVGRELLFKQADEAMYQAKKSGRNTYCFYADVR